MPEEWTQFTEINAKYFELKDSPGEWDQYKEDNSSQLEKNA